MEMITADAALSYAAAESRISFIYGLISGPILIGFGGVMFLCLRRRTATAPAKSEAFAPSGISNDYRSGFDRLVTAVLAEQKRRDRKRPDPLTPERKPQVDEAVLQ